MDLTGDGRPLLHHPRLSHMEGQHDNRSTVNDVHKLNWRSLLQLAQDERSPNRKAVDGSRYWNHNLNALSIQCLQISSFR